MKILEIIGNRNLPDTLAIFPIGISSIHHQVVYEDIYLFISSLYGFCPGLSIDRYI